MKNTIIFIKITHRYYLSVLWYIPTTYYNIEGAQGPVYKNMDEKEKKNNTGLKNYYQASLSRKCRNTLPEPIAIAIHMTTASRGNKKNKKTHLHRSNTAVDVVTE